MFRNESKAVYMNACTPEFPYKYIDNYRSMKKKIIITLYELLV